MKKSKCLLCLLLLITIGLNGQDRRFQAGLIIGTNVAELEGQSLTDYLGWNTGVIVAARLNQRAELGLELLFSQNGEYILPAFYPALSYGKTRLNHIEVPLHFSYLSPDYYRGTLQQWKLNLGLAYARLLNHYVEDADGMTVTEQVIYDDVETFLIQAGLNYRVFTRTELNLKASLPIRKKGLDWTLALRLVYWV